MTKGAGERTVPETQVISALGQKLTARRKEKGVSREAASRDAGIPVRYLDMLEEGRFPTVADPAYLTHFLRRYAAYLGLDPQETARLFLEETEPETHARQTGRPIPERAATTLPPEEGAKPEKTAKPPKAAPRPPAASDRPAGSPAPRVTSSTPRRPAPSKPPKQRRKLPPGWAIYGIIVAAGLGGLFAVATMQQDKPPAFSDDPDARFAVASSSEESGSAESTSAGASAAGTSDTDASATDDSTASADSAAADSQPATGSASSTQQVAQAQVDDPTRVVVPDWGAEPGPDVDPAELIKPKVQPYESDRGAGSGGDVVVEGAPAEEPVEVASAESASGSAPASGPAAGTAAGEPAADEPARATEEPVVVEDAPAEEPVEVASAGSAAAEAATEEPAADEPVETARAEDDVSPSSGDGTLGVEPPYELRITATSRQVWVWVSIDGGPRKAVSLERGDSAQFTAREGYVLTVDDAGGVDATLNGEDLPSFGPRQQARRNMVIPSSKFSPGA